MPIELSNYWDDFAIRVNKTIDGIEKSANPPLERLTVHLTEGCNFRCSYCNMHFSSRMMSEELVRKIIDEYADMGGNIIHFTGGEPTIVPYFEDICAYAKSKGLKVSSNTNAYKKVDTTNIDKLKSSFDTADADEFNATIGVEGFDKIVENMKAYSKQMGDKMLSITAVLNRKTYKGMLPLAKFVEENFDVYNLYYSNYKGRDPEFAFTDDEIEDMFENYIPEVLAYFEQTGNEYSHRQLSLYTKDDFRNVDVRFPSNKTVPCYIQLSEMTVDVDGKCYDCSHMFRDGVEPPYEVSVAEMPLSECFIRRKERFKTLVDMTYLSEACLNGCNANLIGFNKAVHRKEKIVKNVK